MDETKAPALAGFVLPAAELMPGFLIPVFQRVSKQAAQSINGQDVVQDFYPLSDRETIFSLEMTESLLGLKVNLVGGKTNIGNRAVHAFSDGQQLYVGTKVALVTVLEACLSQIITRLQNHPICLAGLHDFLNKPRIATELRRTNSVEFLTDSLGASAKTTATNSRGISSNRSSLVTAHSHRSTSFIEDVGILTALRNSRSQTYKTVAQKPLYAEA